MVGLSFLFEFFITYQSTQHTMLLMLELPTDMSKEAIEKEVLANEQSKKYLEGKTPKKVIVIPQKIVNLVI